MAYGCALPRLATIHCLLVAMFGIIVLIGRALAGTSAINTNLATLFVTCVVVFHVMFVCCPLAFMSSLVVGNGGTVCLYSGWLIWTEDGTCNRTLTEHAYRSQSELLCQSSDSCEHG